MGKLEFDTGVVETSHLDRVLFPDDGITKGEIVEYYRRIADSMVPHLKDRPISMKRYPKGIGGDGFYQQEAPDYFPDWIERVTVDKEAGKIVHALCNHAATLVYLANQDVITPHVWLSRIDRLHEPDQLVFDLDPSKNDFDAVRRAARAVREIMKDRGLSAFVMTTGSRGVHVRAPIKRGHTFDDVRNYARAMARELVERYPDDLTIEQRKNKRGSRIYLDVMRIGYAQTAVPPYAVRPRKGAPIATPLDWDELGSVGADTYTVRNIFRRMGQKDDPWADIAASASPIKIDET